MPLRIGEGSTCGHVRNMSICSKHVNMFAACRDIKNSQIYYWHFQNIVASSSFHIAFIIYQWIYTVYLKPCTLKL